MSSLTPHERQQLSTAIHEYGLDVSTPAQEGTAAGGGSAEVPEAPVNWDVPSVDGRTTPAAVSEALKVEAVNGGGGGLPRSRSFSDMDKVHGEYSNSSALFTKNKTAQTQGAKHAVQLRTQQVRQASRRPFLPLHTSPYCLVGWLMSPHTAGPIHVV